MADTPRQEETSARCTTCDRTAGDPDALICSNPFHLVRCDCGELFSLVQVGWWYEDADDGGRLCWSSHITRAPWWKNARNIRPAYDLRENGSLETTDG